MDMSACLAKRLEEAQEALGELPDGQARNSRLDWLERQLISLIADLLAMQTDIDAGVTTSAMGFSGEDDFQEMLDDLAVEISNLKGLIRTMKSLTRR